MKKLFVFNVFKSFLWFYFFLVDFLIAIFNDKDLTQITDFFFLIIKTVSSVDAENINKGMKKR